ncbi:MAG: ParA family protein [Phormidesmis sp. CAN_BIN44]|nr:ParA family protein [Phormidesmis sp. CAN_BIN44]
MSLIPGDIGMFRLTADTDLFTPALKGLIGFDVVLMDCPPSLSVASVQAILASDRVLVPTLCEPAALKGLSEAVELVRGENTAIPIEVLRTRYKPRLVLTREADDLLIASAEDLNYRLLHTVIPENIQVAESIAQQPASQTQRKVLNGRLHRRVLPRSQQGAFLPDITAFTHSLSSFILDLEPIRPIRLPSRSLT